MSSKMQKNPSIRFKGFTDAWEQRKLEEDISVVGGATPSKSNPEYWNGPIVWLSSQEIKEKYVSKGTYTITKKAVDDNTTKMVKAGTPLIVSRSGILARLFPISIPTTDVAINQDIKALIFDLNIINTNFFVAQLQKNEDFILRSIVKTGTTVQSINMPDFYKLQLSFPSMNEQEKVGKFFQRLDDTIALHQRQLNKYNDLKRTMLQKIFPNNHERAPQVRFDGFTGDWERRKFGDLWRKSSERNNDLKYSSQNVLSVAQMKLNPVERNSTDDYMKTYNVLYYGDIAFEGNKSKNYSFGRFVLNDVQDGIVSHVFISFRPKVEMNIDFMKIYINNENVMKHHLVKATTKTLMMTTLNVHDMNKQFLVIPNIDEQAKIGMFFKKLDDNIALHQKKINNYNCLKKSFLQGMFV